MKITPEKFFEMAGIDTSSEKVKSLVEAMGRTTVHALAVGGQGAVDNAGTLVVSEMTPFGIKQAWLKKQVELWAQDEGVELADVSPEERAEVEAQIRDYHMRGFGPPSDEYKQIDPNVVFQMQGADEVILFSHQPFDFQKWKDHGFQ